MDRYFAQAYGQVQGVGFRYFVQTTAKKYGLTGWVKNMNDGSVTMEVQGEKENIDKLFSTVKKGSIFINVDRLDINTIDPIDGNRHFDIKY